MKSLFSIGEFSKLTGISIHTLRFYDKINLLKPALTNESTSYRYYAQAQLMKLDIIKVCRDIGLDIETIKQLFMQPDPAAFKQGLLAQREAINEKINLLNVSLNTINSISKRIDVASEIALESAAYYRRIKQRKAFSTQQNSSPLEDEITAAEHYLELVRTLRLHNVQSSYQGGFCYLLEENEIAETYIFEVISPDSICPELSIRTFPEGKYFCMSYAQVEREKAISNFMTELRQRGYSPQFICDIYLVDGTFDPSRRRFELQCPC